MEELYIQYTVDSDTLWHCKPNQDVIRPSNSIHYRINSEGLRGSDFPVEKIEGERRLLTIGDSVTFGHLVSEGYDYPHLLEKFLQKELDDPSFRVINGGVDAYSTREELLFIRKKGIGYDPDIVVFGFVLNDASVYAREYQLNRFREILAAGERSGDQSRVKRFLTRSHFVRAFDYLLRKVIPGEDSFEDLRAKRDLLNRDIMYLDSEEAIREWKIAIDELAEVKHLLGSNGISLMLVAFPSRYQLEEAPIPDAPQERLKEFSEKNGILFLDLLPVFVDHEWNRFFIDDVHLSPEGNAFVAEEVGMFLIENGFLK